MNLESTRARRTLAVFGILWNATIVLVVLISAAPVLWKAAAVVYGLRRGAHGSRLVRERRYSAPSVVAEHRVSCRGCTRCARCICLSVLTGGQGWLMLEPRAVESKIAVLSEFEALSLLR